MAAHSFESVGSEAIRRRLSRVDSKKPNVTATYTSLTVSIGLHRGLSLLIVFFLADVGRRRRRCVQ
jgi:hypothetical protein